MSKNLERYDTMLDAIEAERKAEETYFFNLSSSRSVKERIAAGVMWYPVEITKKHYTVGEFVEIELIPKLPRSSSASNSFKIGVSAVFFINKEERVEYRGTISYANRKKVRIILGSDVVLKDQVLNSNSCGIELIFDDRPYKVMAGTIRIVKKLREPRHIEVRDIIQSGQIGSGTEESKEGYEHYQNAGLNPSQNEAVGGCLLSKRVSVIHGPPGTGKTTTLAALATTLAKSGKKVLVTAPSNGAVDLLAKRLHDKGVSVLRIGNVTRIGNSIAHLCLQEQLRGHKEWQHIKQVKIEADNAKKEAEKYKRKFGAKQRQNRGAMYQESRQLRQWARELEGRLVENIIDQNQVICTTLIGCASKTIAHLKFDTTIIDESSQALEPESWTAILKADKVILAGDHMQLPPTVKSPIAIRLKLDETILDRLANSGDNRFFLNTQYRMHPSILSFSNEEYYSGKLKTDEKIKERTSVFEEEPLVFIDTSGCGFAEKLDPETRSRSNREEFFVLREHLLSIYENLNEQSIGIISPYKDQVRLIRREIEEDKQLQALDIDVNSIDGFQGQEKDVIYLSLVRSNDIGEIGFLKDYRRLNVAMTRARQLLVIVGDMATLGSDMKYLKLADHVEKMGAYKSAWEYLGS